MDIKLKIHEIEQCILNSGYNVVDPRRASERSGERVVFNHLRESGFLDDFENKRILEIGPKHGKDSKLLATLNPNELVLLDLPEKGPMVKEWLPQVSSTCKTTYVEGNILYLTQEQVLHLGTFDLIFCLGVLYHNVEQFRLLKKLFDLCNENGIVVIESATTRNKRLENLNAVEILWPNTYRNIRTLTHLPSRNAIKSWLEMVGFIDVKIWNIYSRKLNRHRAVLTGIKTSDSKSYVSYEAPGVNPTYLAGDAK